MAEVGQNKKKYDLVRIWTKPKEELDDLMREKARLEKRRVTEVSMASAAITAFVKKEKRKLSKRERKLGI